MPSLADAIAKHRNPVEMLRNSKIGMYIYPIVAAEFTNWRDEQRAWRESAVLYDQTHHMDEVIIEGPDAAAFLDHVGINSFANFSLNRAKHFVPVTPNGHVIGDHIIFREREDKYILVGRAPTSNWLMFAAAWGSPLIVGEKVYIGDEDGDVSVFDLTAEAHDPVEINMDNSVYSTPIVANDVLYIATKNKLFAIGQPKSAE